MQLMRKKFVTLDVKYNFPPSVSRKNLFQILIKEESKYYSCGEDDSGL